MQEGLRSMYGGLLENRFFHFAAFSLALAIGISQSFSGGSFPLGGDGDFHLSYSGVLRYFYAWSEDGLGTPNYAVEAVWPLPAMLSLLETFMDVWAVKLVLNFSLYFLMFASAYLVCVELKVTPIRCFLLSAFFVLNPLSFSYFSRLNMSLAITPAAMMPSANASPIFVTMPCVEPKDDRAISGSPSSPS